MTLRELNEWMEHYAKPFQEEGISPAQAVALCCWKLSDKVDVGGWYPVFLSGMSEGPS